MNESISLLSKLLDCTAIRHKVLAGNVANSNTPQYKRLDVEFRGELARAVQTHNPEKINHFSPKVAVDDKAAVRGDGNSVSLQEELGEMAENALVYQFATKAITKKFEGLHSVIKGA